MNLPPASAPMPQSLRFGCLSELAAQLSPFLQAARAIQRSPFVVAAAEVEREARRVRADLAAIASLGRNLTTRVVVNIYIRKDADVSETE